MAEIKPNLRTRPEDYSATEKAKLSTQGLTLAIRDIKSPSNLHHHLRNLDSADLTIEAEILAKSYGIYLEFNRAATGSPKDWRYMLRISIPGGGPLTRDQWAILDDVASSYTHSNSYTGTSQASLRLTTRQNIQMHWIEKRNLVDAVREIAESGFYTVNGCGDNVRNTMGCPLSRYSPLYDANAQAQRAGKYFRLPTSAFMEVFEIDSSFLRDSDEGSGQHFRYGPNLLNRKFKIAFSAIQRDPDTGDYVPDNCVELRTNDIGIAPVLRNGKVSRFQVYIGGSQGERNGHPTFATLGQPLGVFAEEDLLAGLDGIVSVHRDWGDRQNRHWARLKYVLHRMGIEWYRNQVREYTGIHFDPPIPDFDFGARNLHHGWIRQDSNGLWAYGAFIENGRVIDGPNGRLKEMVRFLMVRYPIDLFITPNQDLLFTNIGEEDRDTFEADLQRFGYGLRNGTTYSKLRTLSGACVGRDTCRLTYTDSEKFEPFLIDQLEPKWGDLSESIGVTGCERQCFRPATKTIGWVGSGLDRYMLKLGGTEDGRHQGGPLLVPETKEPCLGSVPRKSVGAVTDALFEFYAIHRTPEESRPGGMGYFFRRAGPGAIIAWLKAHPNTSLLFGNPSRSPAGETGAPPREAGPDRPSESDKVREVGGT